jgi:hypothetical protein
MRHVASLSSLLALGAHLVLAKPIAGLVFDLQPDNGGSPADDCDDGKPVTFDEGS